MHIDVLADQSVQISRYESGLYSLIGYAHQGLSPTAAVRYTTDSKLTAQLQLIPSGVTFWAGFNMKTGLFAGAAGRAGRHAFRRRSIGTRSRWRCATTGLRVFPRPVA